MPIPKRILMLEDDAVCAALAKERIWNQWSECHIVHVSNKDEYTNALAGEGFDVILSDYCMPGFSGPQALAQASKECPEVPFLFVSGTITDEVAVESLRAGAVDYILKDRPARLIPAITRALDMAEANSHRIEHEALVNSVDCIFERLHQVKAGDATKEHGIGLGLYLCRELVWLHGGVIWANSQVGKGSAFTFVLPKSQKKTQTDVLIIDDDSDLLETTKLMLESEYQVRTAVDGADGFKEIQRKTPDIVIMDLSMPNVDGVELLKAIRENWDTLPVIVHTAYSNGALMKRAMEYSPFTLLSKPSEMSSLLRAVRCVSLGIEKGLDDETRIVDRSYFLDQKAEKRDRWTNGERPLIQDIETS